MAVRSQRAVDLSHRAGLMPASAVRKLVPFADAARQRGVHIYNLNIGQPDIPTPREMIDAYRSYDDKVLAYGHSAGLPAYRESLSEYYERYDISARPDEILITCGGSEAVIFGLLAVCGDGDNILVPEPFYANYQGFAVMAGVELRPIPTHAADGFHLPAREVIEAAIDGRTRAVLYSSPGNPSGAVFGRAELEMLRDLTLEHGLYLIADEVYREFIYDGERHTSLFHLDGLEDRGILIDSVSKRFSACGARIGCIISRNPRLNDILLRFGQARLCPPTVDQIAARAALATPQSYLQDVRTEYEKRRNVLVAALRGLPGVQCASPAGAFYLMAGLPVDDADEFCQWILRDFELDGKSLMLAPGDGFYVSPGGGKRQVRIAYVLRSEDLIEAVRVLEAALKAYPGSTR
ncbi:MAG: pyridoxal phosphate-dependent aminotransferase [Planctomycetota bacterium]